MKSYVFKVVIEDDQFDDGRPGFSAHCPSLEGAYTWGETREQALERIQEAIKLILDEMRDEASRVLEECLEQNILEIKLLQEHIHDRLGQLVYDRTGRRPMILPVVVEV